MPSQSFQLDDRKFEQFLGNLLRFGVILAAAVVLAGGVLYLIQHGNQETDYRKFRGLPAYLRNPAQIVGDAWSGDSRGIIQVGILLLIATPVSRVILSVLGFLLQRDRTYVLITILVLGVLLFSLFASTAR